MTGAMDAVTAVPRPSAERLARYLSAPSLALGCHPASPWEGGALGERPVEAAEEAAGGDPVALRDRFASAVADCVEGHDHVALLYVNDLASAVLTERAADLCRRSGRRLLVIVADGVAADGTSLAARSQRTIAEVARGAMARIVETERWFRPAPRRGNPVAPDLRHTEFVARASLLAADQGATVLLSPSGADAVLGAPRFLARHLGPGAVSGYLRDAWRASGPAGPLADGLAVLGGRARSGRGGAVRLAVSNLAVPAAPTPDGLSAAARDAARAWAATWLDEVTAALARARPAVVEAAYLRRIAVQERVVAGYGTFLVDEPGGTAVPAPPRVLPFLDDGVVRCASAMPLARRYDPALPVPYQRTRAALVGLMPPRHREHLPVAPPVPGPDDAYRPVVPPGGFRHCADLGLLDGPVPPPGTPEPVLRRLALLDDWLATVPT
ncbi:hypothetical protein [Actinomadura madurae]|uniref:hypothetical protein n=1 Tax=Actinomadura madurae TaxID=1993 RepID=UPI0020D22306|nr:hypothetical protein [Actinomadura madurae]MCP9951113.1 hypothetical protein [Actinomadura madurae]MCQ0008134.1 hypothetical protein [Actinomadura madurae]